MGHIKANFMTMMMIDKEQGHKNVYIFNLTKMFPSTTKQPPNVFSLRRNSILLYLLRSSIDTLANTAHRRHVQNSALRYSFVSTRHGRANITYRRHVYNYSPALKCGRWEHTGMG